MYAVAKRSIATFAAVAFDEVLGCKNHHLNRGLGSLRRLRPFRCSSFAAVEIDQVLSVATPHSQPSQPSQLVYYLSER
jgi:hypothetical protein